MKMPRALHRGLSFVVALAALLTAAQIAAVAQSTAPLRCEAFKAELARDHALACRTFAADGREISSPELAAKLKDAPLVLLGEVHDNPDHHRVRAELIAAARLQDRNAPDSVGPTRSPALVFEHIRADQSEALSEPLRDFALATMSDAQRLAALHALERALHWEESGWPPFAVFRPLFETALRKRLPILPGDPPRAEIRRVAREGLAALPEAERQRLKLVDPLPEPLLDALLAELEASHCGLLPRTVFRNMAVAQRYRDAHQAAALVAASGSHSRAILLAGNGHVRTDRGVPYYLRQMAPGTKAVSAMLLEVEDGKVEPAAYVPRSPDGSPAADYIMLTPRVERPDACEEMRKQFAKPPR